MNETHRHSLPIVDFNVLDERTEVVERETWSDYDGDTLYASYTYVDGPDPLQSVGVLNSYGYQQRRAPTN